ncbi:MAG TPA: hypothetical protein VIW94_12530 [Acidimicrobiia bacterium]
MSDTESTGAEATSASRMGSAIIRGILIGLPIALIGLTAVIYFITDNTLAVSAATAALPGVLLGTFGGGFAGMASTMDE